MDLYELYKEISDRNPDKGIEHHEYIDKSTRFKTKYFVPEWLGSDDYKDAWISARELTSMIESLGITRQIYYDLVILGISTPDDRPKCKHRNCSNEAIFMGSKYSDYCCVKCARSESSLGNTYAKARTGYKQKESTKKKISEKLMGNKNGLGHEVSEEHRRILSEKMAGNKNGVGITPWNKGKKASPELRVKLSLAQINRSLNGNGPKTRGFKSGRYHLERFNLDTYYQSSYEQKFLIYLETYLDVVEVSRKVPIIRYYNPVKMAECNYVPDFLLKLSDGSSVLVEIKPKYLLTDKVVKAKIGAGTDYCSRHNLRYMILTEENLFTDTGEFNYQLDLISMLRSNQSED